MDPDILVTSRLEELRKLLAEGADCVLTPHILEPNEFAAFNEKQMLVYGIYNLGFCALRATRPANCFMVGPHAGKGLRYRSVESALC